MAKKSPYESGELTDSIFLILLATLAPVHGYRIMQLIQEMTGGSVEIGPATMYTTLRKLSESGWIAAQNEVDSKILYQITDTGRMLLLENFNRRKKIMEITQHYFTTGGQGNG